MLSPTNCLLSGWAFNRGRWVQTRLCWCWQLRVPGQRQLAGPGVFNRKPSSRIFMFNCLESPRTRQHLISFHALLGSSCLLIYMHLLSGRACLRRRHGAAFERRHGLGYAGQLPHWLAACKRIGLASLAEEQASASCRQCSHTR
jgi:hypothetical protein